MSSSQAFPKILRNTGDLEMFMDAPLKKKKVFWGQISLEKVERYISLIEMMHISTVKALKSLLIKESVWLCL